MFLRTLSFWSPTMIREIKFRAWDKYWEVMTAEINFEDIEKGFVGLFGKDKELMQAIGLKDKNGKEIFESDIVRFWANPQDYAGYKGHNYIAAVEWDQSFLQFILSDGHGLRDFEFIEVLGNKFENPELLEV